MKSRRPAADLRFLALLLGADAGALQTQLVLLRIGLGLVELFLQLLLAPADLAELFRHTVGDVKAPGAGVVRVQNTQGGLGIVECKAPQRSRIAYLLVQGQQALQPLQIALYFKQLHMIRHLPVPASADGIANVLHLAQQNADFIVYALELLRMVGRLLHIV